MTIRFVAVEDNVAHAKKQKHYQEDHYERRDGFLIERIVRPGSLGRTKLLVLTTKLRRIGRRIKKLLFRKHRAILLGHCYCKRI